MTVPTATITLNAAFLQEIKEDNTESPKDCSEVCRLFRTLQPA